MSRRCLTPALPSNSIRRRSASHAFITIHTKHTNVQFVIVNQHKDSIRTITIIHVPAINLVEVELNNNCFGIARNTVCLERIGVVLHEPPQELGEAIVLIKNSICPTGQRTILEILLAHYNRRHTPTGRSPSWPRCWLRQCRSWCRVRRRIRRRPRSRPRRRRTIVFLSDHDVIVASTLVGHSSCSHLGVEAEFDLSVIPVESPWNNCCNVVDLILVAGLVVTESDVARRTLTTTHPLNAVLSRSTTNTFVTFGIEDTDVQLVIVNKRINAVGTVPCITVPTVDLVKIELDDD